MKLRNPFTTAGRWYKANFHTHTTTSDGRASPPDTAEFYRRAGYHVLALTDHNATNDVAGLSRKDFLVLNGLEYHPICPGKPPGNPHHLVGLNVPQGFAFAETYPADGNACIRAVQAAGGESILAHPLWCGHRYDMYAYLTGYIGIEVHNSTCDKIARSNGEVDWAHLLDAGRVLPGMAVDDAHGAMDRFGGWVWLKLKSLSVAAVMDAVRSGCYYSSTGPKISRFQVRRGQVEVACPSAEFIYLSAQTYHGARRRAEPGSAIRKFVCPVGRDWTYVRAVVIDHRGRKAWTNPIVL